MRRHMLFAPACAAIVLAAACTQDQDPTAAPDDLAPRFSAAGDGPWTHRYKLDEKGGSAAFDLTTGHADVAIDGSLHGNTTRVKGRIGYGAVHLDGSDGAFVRLPAPVGQFGAGDFSVAFWLRTTDQKRLFDLVGNRTEGSGGTFFQIRMAGDHEFNQTGANQTASPPFIVPDGSIEVTLCQSGCAQFHSRVSKGGYNDGQWHHVVATRVGTALTLYIDGAPAPLERSITVGGVVDPNNGRPLKIGRSLVGAAPPNQFAPAGDFDELRTYDRALSAAEVADLYGGN